MNYMLCKWVGKENNAAVKATEDVNNIFLKDNDSNKVVNIWTHNFRYIRNIENIYTYNRLKRKLSDKDNIIIQYPLYCVPPIDYSAYIKLPHNKLVAFIQDIDSYRYHPENVELINKEIEILKKFDVIIAHNKAMIDFLIKQGVTSSFINWEICDYLISKPAEKKKNKEEFRICYVGNIERSDFLRNKDIDLKLNLYGKLDKHDLLDNHIYKGEYNPNDIDCKLDGEFGLIWEGSSIDTCDGIFGNYMHINNPNRLSMYLANDIPIIIWKEAALSTFVVKNKIGFAINKLSEIEDVFHNLDFKEYQEILNNTRRIGKMIRSGYYTKKAIDVAFEIIAKDM